MTGRLDAERQRYELVVDGAVVCIVDYAERGDAVVLLHVETDPRHRGQGRAAELMRFVLDSLRAEGKRVLPRCPYAVAYLAEHREYDDLRPSE